MTAPRVLSLVLCVLALMARPTYGSPITFSDRPTFLSQLGASFTDTYSDPGYHPPDAIFDYYVFTDAAMSAVVGQTKYQATKRLDTNVVWNWNSDPLYCAGCNGTFLLDFTATSYGGPDGVFGVGFDFIEDTGDSWAFVTFGDGSTANFDLGDGFFGITSDLSIQTLHVGTFNGGTNFQASALDNLTIGAIATPEPGTLGLMGVGMVMAWRRRRRRRD